MPTKTIKIHIANGNRVVMNKRLNLGIRSFACIVALLSSAFISVYFVGLALTEGEDWTFLNDYTFLIPLFLLCLFSVCFPVLREGKKDVLVFIFSAVILPVIVFMQFSVGSIFNTSDARADLLMGIFIAICVPAVLTVISFMITARRMN